MVLGKVLRTAYLLSVKTHSCIVCNSVDGSMVGASHFHTRAYGYYWCWQNKFDCATHYDFYSYVGLNEGWMAHSAGHVKQLTTPQTSHKLLLLTLSTLVQ